MYEDNGYIVVKIGYESVCLHQIIYEQLPCVKHVKAELKYWIFYVFPKYASWIVSNLIKFKRLYVNLYLNRIT